MDTSGPQSVSLDIELDSDVCPAPAVISSQSSEKESISLFSFNSPPPCAWDLIPEIPENISVIGLPMRGLQEIELCLNPPSRGSMLNWEYVAAEFGFSNSKIMYLRTSANPTANVLREIAHRPLKNLLNVLAKINRVDALLSLQPYLESAVRTGDNAEILNSDSGAFVNVEKNDILTYSASSSGFVRPKASNADIVASKQKFILVTHHEFITSVALRKNYKWFLKNLRKQAEQVNMLAFDIDDYLETSCQFEGLHALFADASNIVCVFTDEYMEMLKSNGNEQAVTVKQYLHKLMNGEFIDQGSNQRFCAVVFQGTGRDVLPLGWAKSTLVYEFPANHLRLFRKLFATDGM
ncbi:unnamed protein product [Cercopithifilaria johnstoni]|uniref:Uncharacterized protein n=1 Tax=Cercopithifilaria johnstoni TaxID=2874296 RepID=A0A8J2MDI0_9BILA|nr:unnamed protein product [Cercopithifilaria johnstoni]